RRARYGTGGSHARPGRRRDVAGRVTSAEVLAVLPGDRADLDGPVPGARVLGRDLDGLVQVGAVDHVVAADLLFGLGERPVADQQFPIADPHGGGVADVAQPVA